MELNEIKQDNKGIQTYEVIRMKKIQDLKTEFSKETEILKKTQTEIKRSKLRKSNQTQPQQQIGSSRKVKVSKIRQKKYITSQMLNL